MTTGPSAGCGRSSAASAVDGAAGAAAARGAGAASAGRGAAAAISAPALLAANKAGPARFGTGGFDRCFRRAGRRRDEHGIAPAQRSVRIGLHGRRPMAGAVDDGEDGGAEERPKPDGDERKGRGERAGAAGGRSAARRTARVDKRRHGIPPRTLQEVRVAAGPSFISVYSRPKWRSPLRRHYVKNREYVASRAERGSGETRFRRAPARRMNVIVSRGLGIPFRAEPPGDPAVQAGRSRFSPAWPSRGRFRAYYKNAWAHEERRIDA